MKKTLKILVIAAALVTALCLYAFAEVDKSLSLYLANFDDDDEYSSHLTGTLYGFEQTDTVTAKIGTVDEPADDVKNLILPLVGENEKVIYFDILSFDTQLQEPFDVAEKIPMSAEISKHWASGFAGVLGKDYRVYRIGETSEKLAVTDGGLYDFAFETDSFGSFAVIYNPNAITLTFFDGENVYHEIPNLSTMDTITLPTKPKNYSVVDDEKGYTFSYEFDGWYTRESGQGKKLYDGIAVSEIGVGSVYANWYTYISAPEKVSKFNNNDYKLKVNDISCVVVLGERQNGKMKVVTVTDKTTVYNLVNDYLKLPVTMNWKTDNPTVFEIAVIFDDNSEKTLYTLDGGLNYNSNGKNSGYYFKEASFEALLEKHGCSWTEIDDPDFVKIDLGQKIQESNVRYIEIDGQQKAFDGEEYTLYHKGKSTLLEVVEKTSHNTPKTVNTDYYYYDSKTDSVKKLELDEFVNVSAEVSVRMKEPVGLRFRADMKKKIKNNPADYTVKEYGFIIAVEDDLAEADKQLNFDFSKYVTGVAFNRENGIDVVFDDSNDEIDIFTGVLKNIPEKNYKTNVVCKIYTIIQIDGEEYVVYSEQVTANLYDTAVETLKIPDLTSDQKTVLEKITGKTDNALFVEVDDLYN